jgi:hypothetical protein
MPEIDIRLYHAEEILSITGARRRSAPLGAAEGRRR